MIDLCIRKRFTTKGVVYEYRFEIASINGKRKWMTKSGFKTITDARKAGKLAMAQYENYGQVVKDQISVADFLDEWFEKDCMVDLKATTLTNYRKIVDNILKPELGALRLRSLTREQLQTLLTDIYDLGYSKNSLITIKAVLTKSMNYAVDNHYIVYSPAVRLKIPRNRIPQVPTRSTPHFFIRAETMKKIFERFPARSSAYIPLKLGYECGLRLGEVFGLCWEDVDLDAKVIHINRQVQWLSVRERNLYENLSQNGSPNGEEGYWYFSAPKYDSYRTIEISDRLAEVLSSARKAQKKSEEFYEDYYQRYYANNKLDISAAIPNRIGMLPTQFPVNFVCVRPDGTFISPRTMQYVTKIIKENICTEFNYHSLRHTHASILAESGAAQKYIQSRLGHTKLSTTLNVYEHVTDTMRSSGRDIINNIFV